MNYKDKIREPDDLLHRQLEIQPKKREKNKIKLIQLLKQGHSLIDASKEIEVCYRQAHRYLRSYEQFGLFGLLQNKYSHNARKLNAFQILDVGKYIREHKGPLTLAIIRDYIKTNYEVEYTIGGVSSLLRRHSIKYQR